MKEIKCPKCGDIVKYDEHFSCYLCKRCGWNCDEAEVDNNTYKTAERKNLIMRLLHA